MLLFGGRRATPLSLNRFDAFTPPKEDHQEHGFGARKRTQNIQDMETKVEATEDTMVRPEPLRHAIPFGVTLACFEWRIVFRQPEGSGFAVA